MKTPRPHAWTRRAAASTVVALVGLVSLAGCDPRTLFYFLQANEPMIAPPGPSLEDKKWWSWPSRFLTRRASS